MPSKSIMSDWQCLIDTSKVMSIAVADKGQVWSAPVYYLFTDKLFYFFSNPKARHIQLAENTMAAASIFQDHADFNKLAGIQMAGTIVKSPLNAGSMAVAKHYCSHFKIMDNTRDVLGFFASKFNAALFCFQADAVYYMDNSKGFGSREIVQL
ncbi:MAG: pyridoxamine 5'-phosphate oxidase family protein [Proteobacteria bacterium]|nr:pyridoxamine 5'-phosphate oxidase family protein [Pseudomonadota bacterium]MBU4131925.1 pyridoxamine 5'-phosphate oxidase family protein [Pseudomonadota bacterium]